MKYRFVGDIHGQIGIMQQALDCDADRVIFCGDLVDSYHRSVRDQIACVELAIEVAATNRVDVVWANHEWSYFHPQMQCSGWRPEMAHYLRPRQDQILSVFKPFIFEAGYLVTHAGLTKQLWDEFELTTDTFQKKLLEWSSMTAESPFFYIGRARGGSNYIGGPLWCDFNMEFEPIPELPQIFGHTRGNGIRQNGNAWCIDTLENTEPQFLDIEI